MLTMLISEKYLPLRTCRRIVILVFTHVAHTYANLLKQRKCLRCLRRIGLDTNMAAVSLFSNWPSDVMQKTSESLGRKEKSRGMMSYLTFGATF